MFFQVTLGLLWGLLETLKGFLLKTPSCDYNVKTSNIYRKLTVLAPCKDNFKF